jgi:hypothetical protein
VSIRHGSQIAGTPAGAQQQRQPSARLQAAIAAAHAATSGVFPDTEFVMTPVTTPLPTFDTQTARVARGYAAYARGAAADGGVA